MVKFQSLAVAATAFLGPVFAAAVPQQSSLTKRGVVEDSWIVFLKPNSPNFKDHIDWVEKIQADNTAKTGGLIKRGRDAPGVKKTFDLPDILNAYSGTFDSATIEEIKKSHDFQAIYPNRIWRINDAEEHHPASDAEKRSITTQTDAPWGLAAISHRKPHQTGYLYDDALNGEGSYAYIIDTGIRTTHEDFGGRAENIWSSAGKKDLELENGNDMHGHGTHIAGIIGGKKHGVAKNVKLLGVKAFDDQGASDSDKIVEALYWTISHISSHGRTKTAVINMSNAGIRDESIEAFHGKDDAVDQVIELAAQSQIVVVAAAGNKGKDAKDFSPASAPSTIAVGAVDINWRTWINSNYGDRINIYAPGVKIESAGKDSDTDIAIRSGTSMAAAHVAGLVLNIKKQGIHDVPAIKEKLFQNATPHVVKDALGGAPDMLASNGNSADQNKLASS